VPLLVTHEERPLYKVYRPVYSAMVDINPLWYVQKVKCGGVTIANRHLEFPTIERIKEWIGHLHLSYGSEHENILKSYRGYNLQMSRERLWS